MPRTFFFTCSLRDVFIDRQSPAAQRFELYDYLDIHRLNAHKNIFDQLFLLLVIGWSQLLIKLTDAASPTPRVQYITELTVVHFNPNETLIVAARSQDQRPRLGFYSPTPSSLLAGTEVVIKISAIGSDYSVSLNR